MNQRDQELAAEFCSLVETSDLLQYLGLPETVSGAEAQEAIVTRRKRLQSMQNNPKYRDSALFVIKHLASLKAVLAEPRAHLEYLRRQKERELIPMLEMAIAGVMLDGVVSPAEERFIHQAALALGISEDTYLDVLQDRARRVGVRLPSDSLPEGPPKWTGGTTVDRAPGRRPSSVSTESEQATAIQGAAGYNWWDADFTSLLLRMIPGGPGELVDLYCRTASAALTLLPQRPQLSYIGVDRLADRVRQAESLLSDFADRARVGVAPPDKLPLADDSADYVLAVRALSYLPDTRPVLTEARRVLRPGGRIIVAEPDGLGEAFYFDGHLDAYNATFHRLVVRIDQAMRAVGDPAGAPGLSLGPQVPGRLQAAGFSVLSTTVHAANTLKARPFERLARQLRRYPHALARSADLSPNTKEMQELEQMVISLEDRIPSHRVGLCGHMMPMFLTVGVKA